VDKTSEVTKMNEKNELLFWNVDTQYDFMRNDEEFKGGLAVPEARGIEENLAYLTNLAFDYNLKVVNTGDWHNEDSKEISDNPNFVNTFPKHCMKNTQGAQYVPATNPDDAYVVSWEDDSFDSKQILANRNIVIYKDHHGAFEGNKHTESIVEDLKPKRAVVYGVATSICVDYAVNGLLERGIEVYVPLDAIKELPNLPLEETLNAWEKKGAILTTTKNIMSLCDKLCE
jgi:nicotinamidase/pyrazinamidase